jgi:hypothetical protein
MSLFKMLRDYIAALRAQTEATVAATAAANRAISQAAWDRYSQNRVGHHHHGHHHHGHAGGNASLPGAAACD